MQAKIVNPTDLPVSEINEQLNERRPLPMGRTEFMEWSDRIIAGAMVTATVETQRFVLADLLTHLGPQESHKEDAFFIHSLRKCAVNEVAVAMKNEIKLAHTARVEAEKAKEAQAQPTEACTST